MAWRFRRKKGVNIPRVVGKLCTVLIVLWVGGTILTAIGAVLNATQSPFYGGLSLIGYTLLPAANISTAGVCQVTTSGTSVAANTCISNYNGTGVLSVIGIIGVASIVLEFVELRMK